MIPSVGACKTNTPNKQH